MRSLLSRVVALSLIATPLLAQEGEAAGGSVNLLSPSTGLMAWTLIIFAIVFVVLAKFAFGPITAAVRDREAALEAAIASAKADQEAAAALLAQHKALIEAAKGEAQKFISEGRATAESMRAELLESTKKQQDEMLARARRDIDAEKGKAIDEIRREAIDLALAGASKVIEKNLDDAQNRKLVESYLASIGTR
jgi:F-type H+-transporting ATPase subunit b